MNPLTLLPKSSGANGLRLFGTSLGPVDGRIVGH